MGKAALRPRKGRSVVAERSDGIMVNKYVRHRQHPSAVAERRRRRSVSPARSVSSAPFIRRMRSEEPLPRDVSIPAEEGQ